MVKIEKPPSSAMVPNVLLFEFQCVCILNTLMLTGIIFRINNDMEHYPHLGLIRGVVLS